ncbi:MAG: hypothetical protein J5879_03890, partial [Clostridia bacterium]|nr:hypothetical protein [Clostridia bacterium]
SQGRAPAAERPVGRPGAVRSVSDCGSSAAACFAARSREYFSGIKKQNKITYRRRKNIPSRAGISMFYSISQTSSGAAAAASPEPSIPEKKRAADSRPFSFSQITSVHP